MLLFTTAPKTNVVTPVCQKQTQTCSCLLYLNGFEHCCPEIVNLTVLLTAGSRKLVTKRGKHSAQESCWYDHWHMGQKDLGSYNFGSWQTQPGHRFLAWFSVCISTCTVHHMWCARVVGVTWYKTIKWPPSGILECVFLQQIICFGQTWTADLILPDSILTVGFYVAQRRFYLQENKHSCALLTTLRSNLEYADTMQHRSLSQKAQHIK